MKNNRGVSLLELSMVIAVIGLLLAATVQGLSMRKAAEVRGMLTDISIYQTAIEGFSTKYNALPGDMPDAFTYWGTDCAATAGACNGGGVGYFNTVQDQFMAWRHLVLSGFIEGNYTGAGSQAEPGVNVPATKRTKVGIELTNATAGVGGSAAKNMLHIAGFYATNSLVNSALTGIEAKSIDMKMDDGIPRTGSVAGTNANDASAAGVNCITGWTVVDTYIITTSGQACTMTFLLNRAN